MKLATELPTLAAISTRIVIVGTGFAGLGMAIGLRRAGITDFVVLERANEIGGTWRDNAYPGCACDIPSQLYSFSFARGRWSRVYPTQPEIQAYLHECVRRFALEQHIRYESEIVEARYDAQRLRWRIATRGGLAYEAPILIAAMGGLSNPAEPQIAGLDTFAGPQFHSARWRHDVTLAGKRVAVIGTGASAVQFVPEIAPQVAHLAVFQRTPPWVVPKVDGPIGARTMALLRYVPGYAWVARAKLYLTHEVRAIGFTVAPKLLAVVERVAARHMRRAIADPALRARLTPTYRAGCKRILISNDYYPALARPNVELVTSAISRVEPSGVVTADGRHHAADVLVYGTGFRAQDGLSPVRVIGEGGRTLDDAWADGMEAYLGTSVAGFPNFFTLVGPNTGLGHNSMIYMIESQIAYVLDALREMKRRGARAIDVRADVQRAFNARLHARTDRTIWHSGCRSWYLDARGVNRSLWPGFTFEFRLKTRRIASHRYRWIGR
ncbi:MAG: NAD(P)/FAD-dependent oxidoreductase [Vulcanimicrobiaceae bacterium]